MLLSIAYALPAIDCGLRITTFSLTVLWEGEGWFTWGRLVKAGTKKNWSCGRFGACPALQIKFSCAALSARAPGLPQTFPYSTAAVICVIVPFSTYTFAFSVLPGFYIENAAGLCYRAGHNGGTVRLWGGKYGLLSGNSLVMGREWSVSSFPVRLLRSRSKHWTGGLGGAWYA